MSALGRFALRAAAALILVAPPAADASEPAPNKALHALFEREYKRGLDRARNEKGSGYFSAYGVLAFGKVT